MKDELRREYLDSLPKEYRDIYLKEIKNDDLFNLTFDLDIIGKVIEDAKREGYYAYLTDTSTSLLTAYQFGASNVNPLPPHEYCPKCHKFIMRPDVKDAWDIEPRKCECGENLLREGHNISYRILRNPEDHQFELHVPDGYFEKAQEKITYYYEKLNKSNLRKGTITSEPHRDCDWMRLFKIEITSGIGLASGYSPTILLVRGNYLNDIDFKNKNIDTLFKENFSEELHARGIGFRTSVDKNLKKTFAFRDDIYDQVIKTLPEGSSEKSKETAFKFAEIIRKGKYLMTNMAEYYKILPKDCFTKEEMDDFSNIRYLPYKSGIIERMIVDRLKDKKDE